jgi:hypothetical protein
MRRGFGIVAAVVAIVVAVAIGIGAYNVGYDHGLDANGSVQVVRYVGGWHGGFFPFGLLLFPLLIFGFFALMRAAFWGGRWQGHDHDHHGPMGGPGGWGRREELFQDWHRRQHEAGSGSGGSAGGEPAPSAGEPVDGA